MTDKYRIRPDGARFKLTDAAGDTMGVYNSVREAKMEISIIKRDDLMFATARQLVKRAVEAHMKLYRVDYQTAHYWIREAAD